MPRTKRFRKRNKRDNYWDGHNGRIKGQKTEEKFYCAFYLENFIKPSWLKNIRWATNEEDRNGIDFVMETHTKPGVIYIQVKSSDGGIRAFWKKHPEDFKFPMIVIAIGMWHYNYKIIRQDFFKMAASVLNTQHN